MSAVGVSLWFQIAVSALAIGIAASGCGKQDQATAPVTTQVAPADPALTPASAAVPAPTPTATPASLTATTSPAPAAAAPIIAKGDANQPGMRVEINELKRTSKDMVTLRVTLINDGQEKKSIRLYDAGLLDFGEKRRYAPVNKGMAQECICSEAYVGVGAHEKASAWIRFPAPPATVQQVGIEIEGFQPIDDVVISE